MFFICTLSALAVVAALIFAAPLRAKVWTTLAIIGAGALWFSAKAVGVLASGVAEPLWSGTSHVFGMDSGAMDGLSALMTIIISIGAVASTLYSSGYMTRHLHVKSPAHLSLHYVSLAVMFYAMVGVVTSGGGYSFLFFWELMTVASFVLILFDAERREVRRAALTYLILMHIGFVLLLVGFVRLDTVCGQASFAALTDYFRAQPAMPLFVVFLLGFGMKAGLFPMHVWMPEVYSAAPSHVPAFMSGVMSKTGIYGILRVAASIHDLPTLQTVGIVLLAAGIITGLWGVILAALQNDIKRLLAYSSIENIGIILIGLGVAALGRSAGNNMVALCGMAGALLHMINHSLFKSLLFFGAGNVFSQTRTTSVDALGGVAKHMPLTAILFLAGSAAICALPPLNGFVSELLIYLGLFNGVASGSATLASSAGLIALALIGGVAILAFTKLYGTVFLGSPRTHEVVEAEEVDGRRIAAMAIPLGGMLFIGLFPDMATGIVLRAASGLFSGGNAEFGALMLHPTLTKIGQVAWLLIVVVAAIAWLRSRALRGRKVTQKPTWGCGFTSPNVRMQYSGESFSEGLQGIATRITQNSGEGRAVDKNEIFPAAHNFTIRHKDRLDKLFAAWWVELLRLINQRVMRLRTGKINHYILFALGFLVLVFVLSIFKLIS